LTIVIDASLALAWFLPGETSARTEELFDRVGLSGGAVPSNWRCEIANGLLVAERRGRITEAQTFGFIARLAVLPIDVKTEDSLSDVAPFLDLARSHGLTAYDAAYVELAVRLGLPLATNDSDMQMAARRVGLEVL
jgi:predicted nucleic acid-binding protein